MKIFVAFYCGAQYGSEYAAGYEFMQTSFAEGYDLAIISDAEYNIKPSGKIKIIPAPVKKQSELEKKDFFAEWIWFYRVSKYIKKLPQVETIWLQNGAVPWFAPILFVNQKWCLIWGPVGGGESIKYKHSIQNAKLILAENVRTLLSKLLLRLFYRVRNMRRATARVYARTFYAKELLEECGIRVESVKFERELSGFKPIVNDCTIKDIVFVGRNVSRKNFAAAYKIFSEMRTCGIENLHVYGRGYEKYSRVQGIVLHGHVTEVPYESHRKNAFLLITSEREGMPSVYLEARRSGMPVVTVPVGALKSIGEQGTFILSKKIGTDCESINISAVVEEIKGVIGKWNS